MKYNISLLAAILLCGSTLSAQNHKMVSANKLNRNSISFEENKGQLLGTDNMPHPEVRYSMHSGNMSMYLRNTGFSYVFRERTAKMSESIHPDEIAKQSDKSEKGYRLDMELSGANTNAPTMGSKAIPSVLNYYLPQCPNGLLGVKQFRKVDYKSIYPATDLSIYNESGKLQYDFILHPGAIAGNIKLVFEESTGLEILPSGGLRISTPLGFIEEKAPVAYQLINGECQIVSSAFYVNGKTVGFSIGNFDKTKDLIIDPVFTWGTFLGGTGDDYLMNGVSDGKGNQYLTGYTSSTNFPASKGAYSTSMSGGTDLFSAKLDSAGWRVWATYYGGSSDETSNSVTLSRLNHVILGGKTISSNFPVTSSAYQKTKSTGADAVFVSLDTTGKQIYSTYVGGNGDERESIGFEYPNGDYFIYFPTLSTNFSPTTGAFQSSNAGKLDLVLFRFNGAGNKKYLSYYGGSEDDYSWYGNMDGIGKITIPGTTYSDNFPVSTSPYQSKRSGKKDGLILQLDSACKRNFSTYLGGTNDDEVYGVAPDPQGRVYFAGFTLSSDYPVTTNAQLNKNSGSMDGFVGRLDAKGQKLEWSTYFGGTNDEYLGKIWFTSRNHLILAGHTASYNFPITTDAKQKSNSGGSSDIVFVVFDDNAKQLYGTYMGGTDREAGCIITADSFSNIYVGGFTGSSTYPTTSKTFQPKLSKQIDGCISKFFDSYRPIITASNGFALCKGGTTKLSVSTNFKKFLWNTGDTTQSIVVTKSGKFGVTTWDSLGFPYWSDSYSVTIGTPIAAFGWQATCPATVAKFIDSSSSFARGISKYTWMLGTHKDSIQNPAYIFGTSGTYKISLKITDAIGCTDTISKYLNLSSGISPDFSYSLNCSTGDQDFKDKSTITIGSISAIKWYFGDGDSSVIFNPSHKYKSGGNYDIKMIVSNSKGCGEILKRTIAITNKPKAAFTVNDVCSNQFAKFKNSSLTNGTVSYSWAFGDGNVSALQSPDNMYANAGKFKVQLVVKDGSGCSDTANGSVNIFGLPIPSFTFGQGCTNQIFLLTNTSAGPDSPYTWSWDLGDKSVSAKRDPVHQYKTSALYKVILTAKTTKGCQDTISHNIKMNTPPVAKISAPKFSFCQGDSLILDAGSGFVSYNWSNGAKTRSIATKTSGAYTVIVSDGKCIDTSSLVSVSSLPHKYNVSFSGTPRILTASPFSVAFTNTTPSDTSYDFLWKFGDGQNSSGKNPVHSYTKNGYFTVVLFATNHTTGCVDSSQQIDYIFVNGTAIESGEFNESVKVYPNPLNSELNIEFGSALKSGVVLLITDITGRKIREEKLASGGYISTLNLKGETKGVYFLHIQEGASSKVYKLILE